MNALARCNATRPLLNLRKKRKDGMDRAGRRAERPGPNGLGSLNPSGPRHNRMEGRSLKWVAREAFACGACLEEHFVRESDDAEIDV